MQAGPQARLAGCAPLRRGFSQVHLPSLSWLQTHCFLYVLRYCFISYCPQAYLGAAAFRRSVNDRAEPST